MSSSPNPGFVIPPDVVERLSRRVSFEDRAGLAAFLADALNSYLQLGELHRSGGRFVFQPDGREAPFVLRFPFAQDPAEA